MTEEEDAPTSLQTRQAAPEAALREVVTPIWPSPGAPVVCSPAAEARRQEAASRPSMSLPGFIQPRLTEACSWTGCGRAFADQAGCSRYRSHLSPCPRRRSPTAVITRHRTGPPAVARLPTGIATAREDDGDRAHRHHRQGALEPDREVRQRGHRFRSGLAPCRIPPKENDPHAPIGIPLDTGTVGVSRGASQGFAEYPLRRWAESAATTPG